MRTKARPVLVLNIASLTLDIWILSVNAVGEEGNHGKTSLFPLPQPVFLPHQVLLASSQVLCLFHPVDPVDPLDHIGRSNPATNPPYPPYTTPPPISKLPEIRLVSISPAPGAWSWHRAPLLSPESTIPGSASSTRRPPTPPSRPRERRTAWSGARGKEPSLGCNC